MLVPDAVLAPLDVIVAVAVRVAHGHDLDPGIFEETAEFREALRSHADVGQRDLVVGRDEPGATQDMTGNDRERAGGGGGTEETAAVDRRVHGNRQGWG